MPNGVIKNREQLLHQLAVACELEQGLCLQYLFTAFSLKDDLREGGINTMEQLTHVREWKANIFLVAAQEMLHLTQAANLCAAAGGTVQLRRPNFPQAPRYYPTGLPWRLDPFSADVMRRYTCYERPSPWNDPPFGCQDTVPPDVQAEIDELSPFAHLPEPLRQSHAPRAVEHQTIGQLYEAIRTAFLELPNVIIGSSEAQVDGRLVDFPQVFEVHTRDDAVRGIDLIVSQGEGTHTDRIDSHYGVFLSIYREHQAFLARDPRFSPVRPVASNPLSQLHVDNTYPGWRLIDDPYTRDVDDLFNQVYGTMLLMLYRFFATDEESAVQLHTMSRTFLRIMTTVLKPLGESLTLLPMGPSTPDKTAGPSFEIDREIQLLPHKASAWTYLHERLIQGWHTALALAEDPRAPAGAVPANLRNAGIILRQLADGFGAYVPRIEA